MITWKFNDLAITFRSTEANLTRDISKMAWANHIEPDAKITILDGNTNNTLPADAPGGDGDPGTVSQPTVPVGAKKAKTTKPKADELPTVPVHMDNADIEPDLLDLLDSFGDTEQSGNGLDNQPDGQDTH